MNTRPAIEPFNPITPRLEIICVDTEQGVRVRENRRFTAQKMIEEMALDELRAARELTHEHLSKILGVRQAAVSKLERRTDMYVSTRPDFIKAMCGTLEIRAIFPDGNVRIKHFKHFVKTA